VIGGGYIDAERWRMDRTAGVTWLTPGRGVAAIDAQQKQVTAVNARRDAVATRSVAPCACGGELDGAQRGRLIESILPELERG
jgi:hypothetical protein